MSAGGCACATGVRRPSGRPLDRTPHTWFRKAQSLRPTHECAQADRHTRPLPVPPCPGRTPAVVSKARRAWPLSRSHAPLGPRVFARNVGIELGHAVRRRRCCRCLGRECGRWRRRARNLVVGREAHRVAAAAKGRGDLRSPHGRESVKCAARRRIVVDAERNEVALHVAHGEERNAKVPPAFPPPRHSSPPPSCTPLPRSTRPTGPRD